MQPIISFTSLFPSSPFLADLHNDKINGKTIINAINQYSTILKTILICFYPTF